MKILKKKKHFFFFFGGGGGGSGLELCQDGCERRIKYCENSGGGGGGGSGGEGGRGGCERGVDVNEELKFL